MRHYDRGYAEMKRIIASGELGKPLIIKACHRNVSQGPGFKTENGVTNVAIHELGHLPLAAERRVQERSGAQGAPVRVLDQGLR